MCSYKGYMECYDFKAAKWSLFETSLPTPKCAHIMFEYNNKFWFFGGDKYVHMGHYTTWDLTWYYYDLIERKWSEISSIPSNVDNRFTIRKIYDVVLDL